MRRPEEMAGEVIDPDDLAVGMLLGENHVELGQVALIELHPWLALGISKGRFPKQQASVDPNEDAVFGAGTGHVAVLAVADGHHGFSAARAAITSFHANAHELVQRAIDRPKVAVAAALSRAVDVVGALPRPTENQRSSAAALTVAAVAHGEVAVGTLGDTQALLVAGRRHRVMGRSAPYLHRQADAASARIRRARMPSGGALVVMSDGVSGFLGRAWPQRVADAVGRLPAAAAADAIMHAAFDGGAGDHIAVAVLQRADTV